MRHSHDGTRIHEHEHEHEYEHEHEHEHEHECQYGRGRGRDGRVRWGGSELRAAFVRIEGKWDRIYVTRGDGTEVMWEFPTYGPELPHDLVHLVVEAAFGIADGFWGRVDAGVD